MRLLTEALKDYDLSRHDVAKLRQMFDNVGVTYPLSVNWCGIAMFNWCDRAGFETPKNPEVARSWLKVGVDSTAVAEIGDIVVFWRESPQSWKGHVTIYVQKFWENLLCLGGNQAGKVQFKLYHQSRLLGCRRFK